MNLQYSEFWKIPTFERKYFIQKIIELHKT